MKRFTTDKTDIGFITTVTSEAQRDAYEAAWNLWLDYLYCENSFEGRETAEADDQDDAGDYSLETYISFIQYLEDEKMSTGMSSMLRHVYAQNDMEVPPTRNSLLKSGAVTSRPSAEAAVSTVSATNDQEGAQEPGVVAALNAEIARLKKQLLQDSGDTRAPELRLVRTATHAILHENVEPGMFVQLSGKFYQRSSSCYMEVDASGRRTGIALPFSYMRAGTRITRTFSFEETLCSKFMEELSNALNGGLRFRDMDEALCVLIVALGGYGSVDELVAEFGEPGEAAVEIFNSLFPEDEGEEGEEG